MSKAHLQETATNVHVTDPDILPKVAERGFFRTRPTLRKAYVHLQEITNSQIIADQTAQPTSLEQRLHP